MWATVVRAALGASAVARPRDGRRRRYAGSHRSARPSQARERALKQQIVAVRGLLRNEAVQASLSPPQVATRSDALVRQRAARDRHEELLMQRHCFQAMGTDCRLLFEADESAESRAPLGCRGGVPDGSERLLSRFLPDSELSGLNRDGSLDAGPDLVRVTLLALEARAATGGRFDPTIHDALVAAGYDRSFAEIDRDRRGSRVRRPRCGGGWPYIRRVARSSSNLESTSTSAGSPRATPSIARATSSAQPGHASSTRAAISLSAAVLQTDHGRSGSRPRATR